MRHESRTSPHPLLTISSYRQGRLRGHDLWAWFRRSRNQNTTLDSTMFLLLEHGQTLCLTGIGWPAYSVTENGDRGIQRTERLLTRLSMFYLCHLTSMFLLLFSIERKAATNAHITG
ncbi:UNVERIFIED_CONTAM: transmembrane protein, putative [Hammondia hammondi]|eukprot:XP_008888768.1 transmembrane protein, putative [Hammondia hammondi]